MFSRLLRGHRAAGRVGLIADDQFAAVLGEIKKLRSEIRKHQGMEAKNKSIQHEEAQVWVNY